MAKGVKGSSPINEDKPVRTSFIIKPSTMKKVRYIAVMDETEITSIVDDSLNEYITKWEQKHGKIPHK